MDMKNLVFVKLFTKKGFYKNSMNQWTLYIATFFSKKQKKIMLKTFDKSIGKFLSQLDHGDVISVLNIEKDTSKDNNLKDDIYKTTNDTLFLRVDNSQFESKVLSTLNEIKSLLKSIEKKIN